MPELPEILRARRGRDGQVVRVHGLPGKTSFWKKETEELAEQPAVVFRGRLGGNRVVDFGLALSSLFGKRWHQLVNVNVSQSLYASHGWMSKCVCLRSGIYIAAINTRCACKAYIFLSIIGGCIALFAHLSSCQICN